MGRELSTSRLAERDTAFRAYLDQIRGKLEKGRDKGTPAPQAEAQKYMRVRRTSWAAEEEPA